MTLNLEAIKARGKNANLTMTDYSTVFPEIQEALDDLPALIAEVERLRKVEAAAIEYRAAQGGG